MPAATARVAYSAALRASGGTAPYAWSLAAGGLPAGLRLSRAGTISGKPVKAGTWRFTVKVTDSSAGHLTTTRKLSIHVR